MRLISKKSALETIVDNNIPGEITLFRFDEIIDALLGLKEIEITLCRNCMFHDDGICVQFGQRTDDSDFCSRGTE